MLDYSEKRDFLRMTMECPARFRVAGADRLEAGVVKDLSGNGISLLTDKPVAADAVIALEVMPGKTITPPLSAFVKVVRCTQTEEGHYSLACAIERVLEEHEVGADFP
jgi:hypothetical protein